MSAVLENINELPEGWVETTLTMQAGTVSDILHVPVFPFKFLVSFGAFLICLELLVNLVTSIRDVTKQRNTAKGAF